MNIEGKTVCHKLFQAMEVPYRFNNMFIRAKKKTGGEQYGRKSMGS